MNCPGGVLSLLLSLLLLFHDTCTCMYVPCATTTSSSSTDGSGVQICGKRWEVVHVRCRYKTDKRWQCPAERNANSKSDGDYDCPSCCSTR